MSEHHWHPGQLDEQGLLKVPASLVFILVWLMRYPLLALGSLTGGGSGGDFLARFAPDFAHFWPYLLPAAPALLCAWLASLRRQDAKAWLWALWRWQGWLLVLGLLADFTLIAIGIQRSHGRFDWLAAIQIMVSGWALTYLLTSKYLPLLFRERPDPRFSEQDKTD
ncbi:DUF2919 family protein [Gallaecimonas sp. GXIMD4217]|uniref:DUF2919 family protein n=1 Tax=Gallaecimonas sp. GXIMD4217 TaxID=3131927 RepID=UPI00311B138A